MSELVKHLLMGSVGGAVAMHYTEKLLFPKVSAVAARVAAFFKK